MDNKSYLQLKEAVDERKQQYDQNYLDQSRQRLVKIIEKKIMTTGVGAIAAFEEAFGHLWGMDTPQAELTERHKKWKAVWDEVRNRILNRTNDQARAIYNEIKQYTVKWNRYKVKLTVKNQGDDKNG